jgi:hypothetical protein
LLVRSSLSVRAYDKFLSRNQQIGNITEYAGSEFLRAFAHAPEVFQSFVNYYFPLIFETRGSLDMKLTEMVRLKVAEKNNCNL